MAKIFQQNFYINIYLLKMFRVCLVLKRLLVLINDKILNKHQRLLIAKKFQAQKKFFF